MSDTKSDTPRVINSWCGTNNVPCDYTWNGDDACDVCKLQSELSAVVAERDDFKEAYRISTRSADEQTRYKNEAEQQLAAVTAERDEYRNIVIACGRNAGAGLADIVTINLLREVPNEIKQQITVMRDALVRIADDSFEHKCHNKQSKQCLCHEAYAAAAIAQAAIAAGGGK
jgi:hypothetical protein